MGLIKTGLKAAVAVKVAHVVHDRIERRQQAQWATGGHPAEMPAPAGAPQAAAPVPHVAPAVPAAPQAAAPIAHVAPVVPAAPQAAAPIAHVAPVVPTEPPPVSDVLAQLTQLGELKAAGVLTEAEFQTQKARILNG